MPRTSIEAQGLSKQYYIGRVEARYPTIRHQIVQAFTAPLHRAGKLLRGHAMGAADCDEAFWALRDIDFTIEEGEVVGVIGGNGAGKSTLLKILSRITEPTAGRAWIHGRVGSLLEVGTGFHPELTGRENVYLNGSILGMKKREIDRKFDEIVAFSEISKFIDTPIKHYSSGMSVRLAFAVAAFLEPEILIVDEVLAVGDVRFQKKCMGKMQEVGGQGRTVLFVSHNMQAVTRMCQRVILLEDGRLLEDGSPAQVVHAYLSDKGGNAAERTWEDRDRAPGKDVARLRAVRLRGENGAITAAVDINRPIAIEMEYDVLESGHKLLPHHYLVNEEGVELFTAIDQDPDWVGRPRPAGRYVSIAWIPGNLLNEGTCFVNTAMLTLEPKAVEFHERDTVSFQVIDNWDGNPHRAGYRGRLAGAVRPLLEWSTQFEPERTLDKVRA